MLLRKYCIEKFLENTAQKIYRKSRLCFFFKVYPICIYVQKQTTNIRDTFLQTET